MCKASPTRSLSPYLYIVSWTRQIRIIHWAVDLSTHKIMCLSRLAIRLLLSLIRWSHAKLLTWLLLVSRNMLLKLSKLRLLKKTKRLLHRLVKTARLRQSSSICGIAGLSTPAFHSLDSSYSQLYGPGGETCKMKKIYLLYKRSKNASMSTFSLNLYRKSRSKKTKALYLRRRATLTFIRKSMSTTKVWRLEQCLLKVIYQQRACSTQTRIKSQLTHSSKRARKPPLHLQNQRPKNSESISQMTQNPPSLLSLLSPRKMLEKERRKRRRIPIRMMISSMKRTIKSRRSFSLRAETTMTSSGIMMKISHNLRRRKRRRRSRSQHSTLVLKVGPLTLLLLLEETMEKKELEVVVNVENQLSMRKSKTLVASISRLMLMKRIRQAKRVRVNNPLRKRLWKRRRRRLLLVQSQLPQIRV